jgi:hypothetical protein
MQVEVLAHLDDYFEQDGVQVEEGHVLLEVEAVEGEIFIHAILVLDHVCAEGEEGA